MRVLLVPDNTTAGRVIRRHMSRLGHETVGREAIDGQCGAPEPGVDVIVLYLGGIHVNPEQFLNRLTSPFCGVPCIVILGQDQSLGVEEALRSGIQAILREPLRLQELELALARTPHGVFAGHSAEPTIEA